METFLPFKMVSISTYSTPSKTLIAHLCLSPNIIFCTFTNSCRTSLSCSEVNLQATFGLQLFTTMPSFWPSPWFVSWSDVWMIYTKLPSSAPSTEVTVDTIQQREPSNTIRLIKQRMAHIPFFVCVCTSACFLWVCAHTVMSEWNEANKAQRG